MVDYGSTALSGFQMGQAHGAASSPVSAVGLAIKGILKQANSVGLLQEQSLAQGQQARQTAQYKQDIAAPGSAYSGPVPEAKEEGGMFKYPTFNTQGDWSGYGYKTKPTSMFGSFFAEDDDGGNKDGGEVEELTPQQELEALRQILNKKNIGR